MINRLFTEIFSSVTKDLADEGFQVGMGSEVEQWAEYHVTELNWEESTRGFYGKIGVHAHFPHLSSLTSGNRKFSHCFHLICKDRSGDTLDREVIWPQILETVHMSPGPF